MHPKDFETTQRTILSPGPDGTEISNVACIIVIQGAGFGQRIDIGEKPIVIGRDQEANLYLPHGSVSRHHCEVWMEQGRYRVRDLNSTNNTRLNNCVVEVADLADGDHLTIGESILKFISSGSVEARYHQEVHHLAIVDALTGFYNRRHFNRIFDREILRATRAKHPLVLAILDVDLFKRINDNHGHLIGDRVLQHVALIIRNTTFEKNIIGRIGGEEFALLLPGLTIENALAHMESVREAVDVATCPEAGVTENITISIGLANLSPLYPDRYSLLDAADQALYRAKEAGRNRVIAAKS